MPPVPPMRGLSSTIAGPDSYIDLASQLQSPQSQRSSPHDSSPGLGDEHAQKRRRKTAPSKPKRPKSSARAQKVPDPETQALDAAVANSHTGATQEVIFINSRPLQLPIENVATGHEVNGGKSKGKRKRDHSPKQQPMRLNGALGSIVGGSTERKLREVERNKGPAVTRKASAVVVEKKAQAATTQGAKRLITSPKPMSPTNREIPEISTEGVMDDDISEAIEDSHNQNHEASAGSDAIDRLAMQQLTNEQGVDEQSIDIQAQEDHGVGNETKVHPASLVQTNARRSQVNQGLPEENGIEDDYSKSGLHGQAGEADTANQAHSDPELPPEGEHHPQIISDEKDDGEDDNEGDSKDDESSFSDFLPYPEKSHRSSSHRGSLPNPALIKQHFADNFSPEPVNLTDPQKNILEYLDSFSGITQTVADLLNKLQESQDDLSEALSHKLDGSEELILIKLNKYADRKLNNVEQASDEQLAFIDMCATRLENAERSLNDFAGGLSALSRQFQKFHRQLRGPLISTKMVLKQKGYTSLSGRMWAREEVPNIVTRSKTDHYNQRVFAEVQEQIAAQRKAEKKRISSHRTSAGSRNPSSSARTSFASSATSINHPSQLEARQAVTRAYNTRVLAAVKRQIEARKAGHYLGPAEAIVPPTPTSERSAAGVEHEQHGYSSSLDPGLDDDAYEADSEAPPRLRKSASPLPVVLGNDAPTERVRIEGFGSPRRPPRARVRDDGSIYEDRAWTEEEQLKLVEGLEKWGTRWNLVRAKVGGGRSEEECRAQAKEMVNTVDDGTEERRKKLKQWKWVEPVKES